MSKEEDEEAMKVVVEAVEIVEEAMKVVEEAMRAMVEVVEVEVEVEETLLEVEEAKIHMIQEEEEEEEKEEEEITTVHSIGMAMTREMWNATIVITLGTIAMNIEQSQAMKLVSK